MININDLTPAAPSGASNIKWQSDVSGNASAYTNFGASTTVTATPVAGVLTLDATTANNFLVPLTANITSSSVIPGPNGEIITIMWQQNVTGGWTVVMPTNFVGATAPSTASTAVTIQQFRYNSADGNWYAVATGSGAASTDTPHSIPGCALWLSADNITGLVDGNSVTTWQDPISGQVGSFTGTAPIYKTSILNGKPIVRYNGTGAILTSHIPLDGEQFSIFIVMMFSSLANAYTGIVGFGGSIADLGGYFMKSTGKTAFYSPSSAYDGTGAFTAVTGTYYVLSALLTSGATITTRAALALDFTGSSPLNTTYNGTHAFIGNQFSGGRVLSGDIAELIIYNNGLTVTNRNTIENYLKVKYGL